MVFAGDTPQNFKQWYEYNAAFNPGSRAKLQLGFADTFRRDSTNLVEAGDTSSGAIHVRIPQKTRSKIAYLKVYENSSGPRFEWYGHAIDYEVDNVR